MARPVDVPGGALEVIHVPPETPGNVGIRVTEAGVEAVVGAGIAPHFDALGKLAAEVVGGTVGGNLETNLDFAGALAKRNFRWLERVQNYSPWNDVFSMEQQETSLVIDIPFDHRYYFIPYAIGFAWVDGVRLRRINPIQHPYWVWMRACRVAHIGVKYMGSKAYLSVDRRGNGTGCARYKLARFTIAFANYPWDFKEDKDIATPSDEWRRNVFWEEHPTAQMLAAEGGASTLQFFYDVGPSGPPAKSNFRAQMGTPVSQIRYVLNWKWVPYDYAFFGRIPTNIYNAVMMLNQTEAFADGGAGTGFPKGTLLFEPPEITKYVYPVRTRDNVAFMCDIKIPMVYMNPPRGITNPDFGGDARIAALRGHNLCPSRLNNHWYPATRLGQPASYDAAGNLTPGLYSFTDWTTMFTRPTAVE